MITERFHVNPSDAASALAHTVLSDRVFQSADGPGALGTLVRAEETVSRW